MNNNKRDAFDATMIGRAFAAVREELSRDEPRADEACRMIETLRAAINEQNHRWRKIVEKARGLLAITTAREKMDLGSPPELHRFLLSLEELVRQIARQDSEGTMPGQTR